MSCPTKDIAQTEELKHPVQKDQSATIDAPSVLTETIDRGYKDG